MSRFGDARWQRLAVWSGAALAWGSTITAVILEPARAAQSAPPTQVEKATPQTPFPTQPSSGLLVIRYQPEPVEVVQAAAPVAQAQPASQAKPASQAQPALKAKPAPQPKSGGS